MTVDPAAQRQRLDEYATELDELSKTESNILRELEPIQVELARLRDQYEAEMWRASVLQGEKFPPEKVRGALINDQLPEYLVERELVLLAAKKRTTNRISVIKTLVDAHRSILSALKSELEATS